MPVHTAGLCGRSIARVFAGIQQIRELTGQIGRYAVALELGGDVVPAQVFHLHAELIRDKAQQGTMQLFVESCLQVLVQEFLGKFKPLHRHLGRTPVPGCCHIRAEPGIAAHCRPEGHGTGEQQGQQHPVHRTRHEEPGSIAPGRLGGPDETDIFAQVADVLAFDRWQGLSDRRGAGTTAAGDLDLQRFAGQGHITPGADIVVGIFYRRNGEVTVAARNERIFESLAARGAAGGTVRGLGRLDIIDLEVRRETDLRGLKQGDVPPSRNRHDQGSGIVGLEGILAQTGRHGKIAHAAAERGRGSGRQAPDIDGRRRSGHPLADPADIVLEEPVKNTVGTALYPDIDQADQFGRIDGDLTGLLRDQHPATEHGTVVNLVADDFPAEIDIGRRFYLLAPEPVESRELGIFETRDIDPLVELQGCRDRLTKDDIIPAEGQPHEQVVIRNRTGLLSLILSLGGRSARRTAAGRNAAGDHLDRRGPRRNRLSVNGRRCRRKGELTGPLGRKYVCIGVLRRTGTLAVHDADTRGRSALRSPDQLEVGTRIPGEIRRAVLPFDDEGDIELLILGHDVLHIHTDGCLGLQGHKRPEEQTYDCQYPFHTLPILFFLPGLRSLRLGFLDLVLGLLFLRLDRLEHLLGLLRRNLRLLLRLLLILLILVLVIVLLLVLVLIVLILTLVILILVVLVLILILVLILVLILTASAIRVILLHQLGVGQVLLCFHVPGLAQQYLLEGFDGSRPVLLGQGGIPQIEIIVDRVGRKRCLGGDLLQLGRRLRVISLAVQGIGQIVIRREGEGILQERLAVTDIRLREFTPPEFPVAATDFPAVDLRECSCPRQQGQSRQYDA